MAILRNDQALLTFAPEAGKGGYVETATGSASGADTNIATTAAKAGDTSITVASASGMAVGDFLRIGTVAGTYTATVYPTEVRRIEYMDGTQIHLDAPLGFDHPTGTTGGKVMEIPSLTAFSTTTTTDGYFSSADYPIIRLTPGIWETIDAPDPEPTITPRWFLGNGNKRNFSVVTAGMQNYVGSVPGMVMLNGKALRFAIGKVVTKPRAADLATAGLTITEPASKGDIYITASAGHGLAADDMICIDDNTTTKSEVRRIVAVPTTNVFKLDFPLQFAHDDNASMEEVGADGSGASYYTHTITETTDLDSVTWNLAMLDSAESTTFIRRYYGGKIGQMVLEAEEGGLLTVSWDSVNFMGMVHNQATYTDKSDLGYGSTKMPMHALMHNITNTQVEYPTTEPYYFSQGEVKFFGTTFARVRNFNLSISNNDEPRHYITARHGRNRGPSEIVEGRREYTMACTLVLPDADATESATVANSQTLFKELLLEGNYGTTTTPSNTGFSVVLTFTRGADDTITITMPDDGTAAQGIGESGAYIMSATHNITTEGPMQIEVDMIIRNLKIVVVDSDYLYV
tara:strand:+ start:2379 stop:4097 length:1719 start_codon:yes stop_codon:yes gene_type:complete